MLGQGWAGLLVDDGRGLVHVSICQRYFLETFGIFFQCHSLALPAALFYKMVVFPTIDKLHQGCIPPSPRCRMEMQKDEQRQQKMAKRPSSWTCFGATGFPKLRVGFGDENGSQPFC